MVEVDPILPRIPRIVTRDLADFKVRSGDTGRCWVMHPNAAPIVIFIKDLLTHLIHRLLDHNVDSVVTEENSSMKRAWTPVQIL